MTRYSRSVPEGLSALERLAADDVRVLSASEDLDATTPEGELSLTMFLAMAQYQVRRIGASWRNVIERNKRAGEIRRDNHGRPLREPIPGTERHVRGRHEPLVSARDFVEVRRRLRSQAKPRIPRHIAARWSAAGLTKCGGCLSRQTSEDSRQDRGDCGRRSLGSCRRRVDVERSAAIA